MEEEVEAYLSTLSFPAASQNLHVSQNMQSMPNMSPLEDSESPPESSVENILSNEVNETTLINHVSQVSQISLEQQSVSPSPLKSSQNTIQLNPALTTSSRPFYALIDDLTEFNETILPESSQAVSVADALYKLEASRDIPTHQAF